MKPLTFTLAAEDFITFLLPEAPKAGTEQFKNAVLRFYVEQFAPLGGNTVVTVDDKNIHVQWIPDKVAKDPFGYALDLLQHGELTEAVPLLESFLAADPNDTDALYNLGMALSDLGRLDEAKRHLSRLVEIEPNHVNGLVALGVAHQRSGDSADAVEVLEKAVDLDPNNGYARRNLGAILANSKRNEDAEQHLREAYRILPQDQASVYGLAQCLEASGEDDKLAEADRLYVEAIELDQVPQITELARRARSSLAQQSFRETTGGSVNMAAVMYCLSALQKFSRMKPPEVQGVAFEIAMLGMRGIDPNDAAKKYTLRSMPGTYSGLELLSIMYVGFKQIAPDMDSGFDLSKEYQAAQQLFAGGRKES
jgi:tetratricopeptide (TPR) repeat protein